MFIGGVLSKVSTWAVYMVFTDACICPGLAMNIRRIRDTGRSWQWIFISLIPFVGVLWLLWIELQPSADA